MSFDDDLNACAAIVEKGDPHRFRTVMAAPLETRKKLFPLYAFNVEVSRAPWVTAEPMIAEMRLQWWRDALEEIGAKSGIRRHEVVTPLSRILTTDHVRSLDELVAARRWDCYKDPFEDSDDLTRYLRQTSGHLMQVSAAVLGCDSPRASAAGEAFGVANWLRAIPGLEAQKRVPLVDGTADGVRDFAQSGLKALARAKGRVPRTALPAFWPASGVGRTLKAVVRTPGLVAAGAVPPHMQTGLALKVMLGRW